MRYISKYIIVIFILTIFNTSAEAKKRALLIGNNKYQNVTQLQKAVNDANMVARTLSNLKFEVTTIIDADRRQMSHGIAKFTNSIEEDDEVLFYFSGHGISIDNDNLLLPIDIPDFEPGQDEFVKGEAISEHLILRMIRAKEPRVSVLIIDACRNNPFKTVATKGVGSKGGVSRKNDPPSGFLMLYSAGSGQQALDRLSDNDPAPNSVFTRELIPLMNKKGLELRKMALLLRTKVKKIAESVNHNQNVSYYDNMIGKFFFIEDQNKLDIATQKGIDIEINSDKGLYLCNRARGLSNLVEGCSIAIKQWEVYQINFPNGSCIDEAKTQLIKLKNVCTKNNKLLNSNLLDQKQCQSVLKYTEKARDCQAYNIALVKWQAYKATYDDKGHCQNQATPWIKYLKNQINKSCYQKQNFDAANANLIPTIRDTPKIIPRDKASRSFNMYDGFDVPYGDYTKTGKGETTTLKDCIKSCRSDNRCIAFTYNSRYQKCFLKDKISRLKAWSDAYSGVIKSKSIKTEKSGICGLNFSTYNNVDFLGGDIQGYDATLDQCSAICRENTDCRGFSWLRKPVSKQCWIKYALNKDRRKKGVISCVKFH